MLLFRQKVFILTLSVALLSFTKVLGQTPVGADVNSKSFEPVEKEAEFPGGAQAFAAFIQQNLKYTEVARFVGINGKVRVSFTVSKDGSLKNIRALDTIGLGCEQAAVDAIAASPKWKPATQNNIPIEVKYSIPITFAVRKEFLDLTNLAIGTYGFLFEKDGKIYKIEEAMKILGSRIPTKSVQSYTLYKGNEFSFPKKEAVYLVKLKS